MVQEPLVGDTILASQWIQCLRYSKTWRWNFWLTIWLCGAESWHIFSLQPKKQMNTVLTSDFDIYTFLRMTAWSILLHTLLFFHRGLLRIPTFIPSDGSVQLLVILLDSLLQININFPPQLQLVITGVDGDHLCQKLLHPPVFSQNRSCSLYSYPFLQLFWQEDFDYSTSQFSHVRHFNLIMMLSNVQVSHQTQLHPFLEKTVYTIQIHALDITCSPYICFNISRDFGWVVFPKFQ
jgi:hypothetical protein